MIIDTLRVIGDLVENILSEITQTKRLCYECVKDFIDAALWLFPIYVRDPKMTHELFSFFHVVFDVLKSQMGANNVQEAIRIFLSVFDKDQLRAAIEGGAASGGGAAGNGAGNRVVEKFLGILEFVVKEPNSTFRQFIPQTIELCLQHVYPLVAEVRTNCTSFPINFDIMKLIWDLRYGFSGFIFLLSRQS